MKTTKEELHDLWLNAERELAKEQVKNQELTQLLDEVLDLLGIYGPDDNCPCDNCSRVAELLGL